MIMSLEIFVSEGSHLDQLPVAVSIADVSAVTTDTTGNDSILVDRLDMSDTVSPEAALVMAGAVGIGLIFSALSGRKER